MTDAFSSDAVTLFEQACVRAAQVMAGVEAAHLVLQTPCSEWNVQQLIDHMVGGPEYLLSAVERRQPTPPNGADVDAYRSRVSEALGKLADPDVLGRECASPIGFTWTVEQAVAGTFMDQLIHTWDLATATGQDRTLEPQLVERCMEIFLPHMPEMGRAAGLIGPAVPVPDDALAQDRLLGALGRRP